MLGSVVALALVGRQPALTITQLDAIRFPLPATFVLSDGSGTRPLSMVKTRDSPSSSRVGLGPCSPFSSVGRWQWATISLRDALPRVYLDICQAPVALLTAVTVRTTRASEFGYPRNLRDFLKDSPIAVSDRYHADFWQVECLDDSPGPCHQLLFRASYGQYLVIYEVHSAGATDDGTIAPAEFIAATVELDRALSAALSAQ